MGVGLALFGKRKDGSKFPVDITLGPVGVYHLKPKLLPSVIGGEGAGIVEAIGSGVSRVKVGDRVTIPFHASGTMTT